MDYPQERKEDTVRFQRTGERIQQCFMDLVAETSFAEVSIVQVCKAAEVSRQTFYEHFADKFVMLEECLRSILIIPNADSLKYRGEPAEIRVASLMRVVAEKCAAHRGFLRSVTEDISLPAYHHLFFGTISEGISETLKKQAGTQYPQSDVFDVQVAFASGGVLGALRQWLARSAEAEIDPFCQILTGLLLDTLGTRRRSAGPEQG